LSLFFILSQAVVHYCCTGITYTDKTQRAYMAVAGAGAQCGPIYTAGVSYDKCFTYAYPGSTTGQTGYGCSLSTDTTSYSKTCTTDFCNCPAEAHKDVPGVQFFMGEMRKIMYPIMGMVFAIIWVVLAFLGGGPVMIVLLIVGIVDVVFGIFLIFLPVTTYLGLFFAAVGALTVAVSKHGGEKGITFIIILTALVWFVAGGLTVFGGYYGAFHDVINNYITNCQGEMNIINWDGSYLNLDTRCENWALFVAFCVFFLFLIQPIAMISLFFKQSGGGGGSGGGHGGSGGGHGVAGAGAGAGHDADHQ